MRWAEDQTAIVPANRRPQPDLRKLIDTLADEPGRWFELDTYPVSRKQSARSRGSQIVRRYPVLDYAVTSGYNPGEVALYLRVRP